MSYLKKYLFSFSAFFALTIYAQDSDVSSLSSSIEEIVVTARATEESIRDIPVAITAYSEEEMEILILIL